MSLVELQSFSAGMSSRVLPSVKAEDSKEHLFCNCDWTSTFRSESVPSMTSKLDPLFNYPVGEAFCDCVDDFVCFELHSLFYWFIIKTFVVHIKSSLFLYVCRIESLSIVYLVNWLLGFFFVFSLVDNIFPIVKIFEWVKLARTSSNLNRWKYLRRIIQEALYSLLICLLLLCTK